MGFKTSFLIIARGNPCVKKTKAMNLFSPEDSPADGAGFEKIRVLF
jgi:hypothetical protein